MMPFEDIGHMLGVKKARAGNCWSDVTLDKEPTIFLSWVDKTTKA